MYNVRDYIVACVDSVYKQLPDDSEIIVVNDGSSDDSYDILREYVEKNNLSGTIKILQKENSGASASRNYGIQQSSGEFIIFMDSDDVMADEAFANIYKTTSKNDSDLYVFSLIKNINGKIIKSELSEVNEFFISNNNSVDLIVEYLNKTKFIITWQPWSKVFKRDIIVDNNIQFNDSLYCCNDFDFFFKYLLFTHSISFCNKIVNVYTMDRPGRISETKLKKRFVSMLDAYTFAFDNVDRYIMTSSASYGGDLLNYLSYLYICSFDLASSLDNKTIKDIVERYENHNKIFNYSNIRAAKQKRIMYFLFGIKKGATLIDHIRHFLLKLNLIHPISYI